MGSALQIMGAIVVVAVLVNAVALLVTTLQRSRHEARLQRASLELLNERVKAAYALRDRQENIWAWNGIRKFVVAQKVSEAPDVYSFLLKPHDRRPLPAFQPGQYLTFHLRIPGQLKPVVRCYSLSECYRGDYYRVTIKRVGPPRQEPDAPAGVSSSYFCDQVEEGDILDVEAPRGHFYLDMTNERPVVLIGGGIGITPVLSMLKTIAEAGSARETWFFLGVRNRQEYLFKNTLRAVAMENKNVQLNVCYSNEQPRDSLEGDENSSVDLRRTIPSLGTGRPTLVKEGQTARVTITRDSMIVGRAPESDICIGQLTVSGTHARIYCEQDRWFLEDLGSTNGTSVRGEFIDAPTQLQDRDPIRFGTDAYQIEIPSDQGEADFEERVHYERISADLLKSVLPSTNYVFFLCGPSSMMTNLGEGLKEIGVPESDIRFEAFGPATIPKPVRDTDTGEAEAGGFDVKFARSARTCSWTSDFSSLLELAEKNGISIPAGCRAGSCGTCSVAVKSGKVEYGSCKPSAAVESGSCLACIAAPVDNVEIDA